MFFIPSNIKEVKVNLYIRENHQFKGEIRQLNSTIKQLNSFLIVSRYKVGSFEFFDINGFEEGAELTVKVVLRLEVSVRSRFFPFFIILCIAKIVGIIQSRNSQEPLISIELEYSTLVIYLSEKSFYVFLNALASTFS
ncbi:hypothetical protein M9Y10_000844 [Tritrichomonas musculus]|uniref:Uncharacterized protein n=1 Tax=Tritrichomonas musculus TaxID=1915356 RepID=A0ABR2L5D4_9EUKA